MITVFWKELRENARWASLGFVAMAAALILMWRRSQLVFDDGDPHMFAGMIAVFTATALGILQTRRDKRPAARALLLHRGITADAAFAGKLLAGLALYSFAVFVPLLAMAIFIAINGIEHKAASPISVAPMALRSLAPFAFWPVALLIVQRDARVLGSRLTPAVPTLFASLLCFAPLDTTRALFVFFLILVLSLVVLLLAARSVFTNSGQIATGIGRAALALTVSFAFLVILLVTWTIDWQLRAGPAAVNRQYAVQMGPEGQPWLVRNDHSRQHESDQLTQAAKMAIGRSVRDQLQPIAEDWKKTPHWSVDRPSSDDGRRFWTRFTRMASTSSSRSSGFMRREWVFDRKSDTILVYHLTLSGQWQLARRSRAPGPVGSFGQIRRCGQSDTDGNFTLVTSTAAFYVPGDGSAIITMYLAPTSSTILGSVERHTHDEDEPFAMMLRLADRVVLLESDLEEIAASQARLIGEVESIGSLYVTEIQLPSELALIDEVGSIGSLYVTEIQSLSIARDPVRDGAYLGLAQSGKPSERRILWARFDASGQIAAQQQFTENTSPEYTEDTSPDAFSGESVVAVMPPAVLALSAGFAVIAMGDHSIESIWESDWESAWKFAREDPAGTARIALLLLLQPIVGMALAIWAARRRRLDKRQTWLCIAWGFLLGPFGSLSVLAVYPRIVRDRCISCQKPKRIDLDHCEHCSHPADDVPKIGIEIFGRDTLAASKPAETISSC